MGYALNNRWMVLPVGVARPPSSSTLPTAITSILAAEARAFRPGLQPDRYLAAGDSGEYPIVPVGRGFSANVDLAKHLSMLDEVSRVLEVLKRRMTGIENVMMALKLKEPGLVARNEDLLLGIPLKQDIAAQPRAREWHVVLEETAAVLHVLSRRLSMEGEFRLALGFLNRSLTHYFSLGTGLYEGWIQGVQADIQSLPPQASGERKTSAPFALAQSLAAYRKEFMTESGRYSFAPPSNSIEDIFAPPDFRGVKALQREVSSSVPSLPTLHVVQNVFEQAWLELHWGRRLLLSRALHRIQTADNQSAMQLLSQMVWWLRKKNSSRWMIDRMLEKGIKVLDIFLNRSPHDTVAQMVIDAHPFTHHDFVRHKKEFIFFGTIEGVEIYSIDPKLS